MSETERFADPLDRASIEEQRALEESLRVARSKPVTTLPATGTCHNCSEPVSAGERFCDKDCRDDYEHIQQRRAINRR